MIIMPVISEMERCSSYMGSKDVVVSNVRCDVVVLRDESCLPSMSTTQYTVNASSNATLIKKNALPTLVIARIRFV